MSKRNERHYLIVTDVGRQTCDMYDLGSSFPFARIALVKAKNKWERSGYFGRFIGPAILHIYSKDLTPIAILKVFTIAVPSGA